MKRIIIIGRPGSGKSTLAVKLAKKLGLPLIHLDKMFWQEGWTETPKERFDEMLITELQKAEWIMDGNYGRTIPLRVSYADTVICFEYPKLLCVWRVLKRVIVNYGKTRPDMGQACPERFDLQFMKFVWKCPSPYEKIMNIQDIQDKNVILIKNKRDYKRYFSDL